MPMDPPNEPETPTRELTRPEAYALGQKLLDAHHALADRDFEQAENFWSEARSMAADSDQEVLVDRLQIVGQTTRRCWDAIAKATSQLESTEELQFSPTVVVVVVEASEEKLIYRVNGERQERAPRDLPPGLGKLILESVLEPGVELSTLLGALYAAESANDPTKRDNAETYWREADASGGDMRDLLGWLTDDYDLVGQNYPPAEVPSKDEIETAKEQVTDAISQVTSDARTPIQRIEAGNELIDLAVKLDATPEAYVHFSEATSLIAGSGLISELKIPLEKWANWFEIDDLTTRTALLERCSRVGAPTEECQETVRQSLELAQRALGKKEFDLVDRLLDAANGAAQKSKDQQTRSETLLKVRQLKQRLAQAKADA